MSDPEPAATRPRRPRHRLPEDVLRFQEALLPASVPLLPRADLAASYLPGGDPAAVGGDWFDATSLPGDRLILAVGDVVGEGLEAVAAMGQVRAVLASRLYGGGSLLDAINAVDLLTHRTPTAFASTLCVASLDLNTGVLSYATRGHPAPVVIGATGARLLPVTGDGPLGTRTRGRTASTRLSENDVVLMFTDGVLRGGGGRPARALDRIRRSAAELVRTTPSPVAHIVEELPRMLGGSMEDSILLAAQYRSEPRPLELVFNAAAERLAHVRSAVDDWTEGLGLGPDERRKFVLGISELVANSVEHAYAGTAPGPVQVNGHLTSEATVVATVTDRGRWREPTPHPGDRGRGLSMSAALGLRLEIDVSAYGTQAVIEAPARRALRLLAGSSAPVEPTTGTRLTIVTADRVTVQVSGPLSGRKRAAQLEAEVRRVARNGLVPVDLDLRRASCVSGPGINALESLLGPDGPGDVRIIADPTSAVGDALALTGTPFATEPDRRGTRQTLGLPQTAPVSMVPLPTRRLDRRTKPVERPVAAALVETTAAKPAIGQPAVTPLPTSTTPVSGTPITPPPSTTASGNDAPDPADPPAPRAD